MLSLEQALMCSDHSNPQKGKAPTIHGFIEHMLSILIRNKTKTVMRLYFPVQQVYFFTVMLIAAEVSVKWEDSGEN
jgi:hypothetical protein